jgi:hypothetical protein
MELSLCIGLDVRLTVRLPVVGVAELAVEAVSEASPGHVMPKRDQKRFQRNFLDDEKGFEEADFTVRMGRI